MLKTDLEILEFIHQSVQSGSEPDTATLQGFIGESVDQRLFKMVQDQLVKRNAHWLDDRPSTYTLSAKGEDLLARHHQQLDEEADRKARDERKVAAQQAQAVVDTKQKFRHDFKVAAFTVILTLTLEHIADIVDFLKNTCEAIRLLLE